MAEPTVPSPELVSEYARLSVLRAGPGMSELADLDELRYRDEIEEVGDVRTAVPAWLERKQLVARLDDALRRAGIVPRGRVAELGAGSCWLGAALTRSDAVEHVVGIEFSERRLRDLAPVAIAAVGGDPSRVERVVADFYAHDLPAGSFDLVFTDAAFHHAEDPVRLSRVAFDLLRPGGRFVLFREPTLTLVRRTRDHGIEDDHGSFEHEYFARQYLGFLRAAGFDARKHRAVAGFRTLRERVVGSPLLAPLNGVVIGEYTYVGTRP